MNDNSFVNRLVVSAQENPLAAALIMGGLLWMVAGNRRLTNTMQAAAEAASPMIDTASRNMHAPPLSRLNDVADTPGTSEKAQSAVTDSISRWRDAAKDGLSNVRDRVTEIPDPRPAIAATYGGARTMLADIFERQPLVLGVMGLGIGAAIAGAFSTTPTEQEFMGSASETMRADLGRRTSAVADRLREGGETLKSELSDTGAEAFDRLQQAGRDAANAAREKAGV